MEIPKAIDRVRHLAKIYAAQALKPPGAQRPSTPEDKPNATALSLCADLALVGADAVTGPGWRDGMCRSFLFLASDLTTRGVEIGHWAGDQSATRAAVAEIDRLRAEVERLSRGIGLAQVALRDHAPDTVWFDEITTLFDMLEHLRDHQGLAPLPAETQKG